MQRGQDTCVRSHSQSRAEQKQSSGSRAPRSERAASKGRHAGGVSGPAGQGRRTAAARAPAATPEVTPRPSSGAISPLRPLAWPDRPTGPPFQLRLAGRINTLPFLSLTHYPPHILPPRASPGFPDASWPRSLSAPRLLPHHYSVAHPPSLRLPFTSASPALTCMHRAPTRNLVQSPRADAVTPATSSSGRSWSPDSAFPSFCSPRLCSSSQGKKMRWPRSMQFT